MIDYLEILSQFIYKSSEIQILFDDFFFFFLISSML